jgi:hypothetical protein
MRHNLAFSHTANSSRKGLSRSEKASLSFTQIIHKHVGIHSTKALLSNTDLAAHRGKSNFSGSRTHIKIL